MAFAIRDPRRRHARPAARDAPAPGDATVTRSPGRVGTAAGRGAWAVGSLMVRLARLVHLVVGLIVLVIAAAILLRVLGANPSNSIVRDIHDAGKALAGPFDGMFSIKQPKVAIAVNWGIAAVVWLVVGSFVARLIALAAPRGIPPGEPVA